MRALMLSAWVSCGVLVATGSASADVRITISDGYVSVDAQDVTVRQILSEWSRVGQTRIVGGERVAGAPVSLKLVRVPEAQALDILLRSVSGYMAAPRAVPDPNASLFDRILVMPTSAAPRAASPLPPQPQPTFQPPMPVATEEIEMDDPGQPEPGAPGRGPIFPPFANPNNPGGQVPPAGFPTRGPVFPPPGNANPNMPPAPASAPPTAFPGNPIVPGRGAPAGVSVPGMVVPVPQPQPGVPPEPQE